MGGLFFWQNENTKEKVGLSGKGISYDPIITVKWKRWSGRERERVRESETRQTLKWKFIGYPNGFRILQTDRTLILREEVEKGNGGEKSFYLYRHLSFPYLYVYSTKTKSTATARKKQRRRQTGIY